MSRNRLMSFSREAAASLCVDDAVRSLIEEIGVCKVGDEFGALGLAGHDDSQLRRRVVQRGLLVEQAALGDEQGAVG